jgi:hypothetical protein
MKKKRYVFLIVPLLLLVYCLMLIFYSPQNEIVSAQVPNTSDAIVSENTEICLVCHTKKNPAIVISWRTSKHAEVGIGCYECHTAEPDDPDKIEHYNDTLVSSIVSPEDCSVCHETEAEQFLGSHHAKGGEILGSLDNYLGEVVEGFGASVSGCQQCHGSKVVVEKGGRLSAETWPNFGIGRINPDGSSGACSACHSRHDFSIAQARTPETCGRCHLGPDHPQMEVYEESKHNIAYRSHQDEMNMDSDSWIVGVDYAAAPTCATCHVSATLNQARTHDIGLRLSWNIRADVSFETENAKKKRGAMKDVCYSCHNPKYVDNFYKQFDAGIELYNEKFAKPAKEIIEKLREAEAIDPTPFNEEIEWVYFYLWHHEGRRARNGIAMMGPDYVQWHGFYDIAERFYIELIPEAEHLLPGVTKEIMERPEHKWFSGKMTKEEREGVTSYYKKRYEQKE